MVEMKGFEPPLTRGFNAVLYRTELHLHVSFWREWMGIEPTRDIEYLSSVLKTAAATRLTFTPK